MGSSLLRFVCACFLFCCLASTIASRISDGKRAVVLQPVRSKPAAPPVAGLPRGSYYVPATAETIRWGYLPNRNSSPILTVPSASIVTFDTVSHEGILEDQGRDPVKYFVRYSVPAEQVLDDAKAIAGSNIAHDFAKDGPHIVIGPVAIEGAQPGDVLKVEMLSLTPRVPYGVISNRHGKGALAGEFPEGVGPQPGAGADRPELYHNVSTFAPIREINGRWFAVLHDKAGQDVRFPIQPFMGTMGTAPNVSDRINSIPPSDYGGNLDIKYLTAAATLYLPIQVAGALFYMADPHFAQGNGEVALTAVEGSLRTTVRLTVLKAGDASIPGKGAFTQPFAETPDYWIAIGLDPNLDEAMKKATRAAVKFLAENQQMDRATALAYLSAAADFEVSQVVDRTKGIQARIRKMDFARK